MRIWQAFGEQKCGPLTSGIIMTARGRSASSSLNLGDALACYEAADHEFERVGHLRWRCVGLYSIGDTCLALGQYERAESVLQSARIIAAPLSIQDSYIVEVLGLVLVHLERLDEGQALIAQAMHDFRDSPPNQGRVRARVARTHMLAGDYSKAETEARLAVELLEGAPAYGYAKSVIADALLARGRCSEAATVAREAIWAHESEGGLREYEPFVRLMYAEALYAAGDVDAAVTALRDARQRLLTSAERIADPVLRHSFLTRVPEHARTVALAREWLLE